MRWFLSLLLCCALPAQALTAQALTVEVSAQDEVEFGHSFPLVVKIIWEDGLQLEPVRAEQFAPLEVRELSSEFWGRIGRNERTLRFQAFAFQRDELVVPSLTVVARAIDDGTEYRASSEELRIVVHSSLAADDSGEMDLPQLPAQRAERGWWFYPVLLSVLFLMPLLVSVIVLWIRRRRRRQPVAVEVPADVAALQALDRMRAEEPEDLDAQRDEAIRAAAAVQRYVEVCFDLQAGGQTSEEFLASADTARALSEEQREVLTEFLMACDLLKYARRAPARVEREQLLLSMESFIEETRTG